MAERSIEDLLREQYFDLLPTLLRAAASLKTQIEHALLPVTSSLAGHETVVVKARVKDCASAIDKLRQSNPLDPSAERNPGGVFDRDRPEHYHLFSLRDLVGARVLVFPSGRGLEADKALREKFSGWTADPVTDKGNQLAYKYNGSLREFGVEVPCEYQIVSTLIGLFWEIEHAAIYKQSPKFKGIAPLMQEQTSAVYQALRNFEDDFEAYVSQYELGGIIFADDDEDRD